MIWNVQILKMGSSLCSLLKLQLYIRVEYTQCSKLAHHSKINWKTRKKVWRIYEVGLNTAALWIPPCSLAAQKVAVLVRCKTFSGVVEKEFFSKLANPKYVTLESAYKGPVLTLPLTVDQVTDCIEGFKKGEVNTFILYFFPLFLLFFFSFSSLFLLFFKQLYLGKFCFLQSCVNYCWGWRNCSKHQYRAVIGQYRVLY